MTFHPLSALGELFFPTRAACLCCHRMSGIESDWLCPDCRRRLLSRAHCVHDRSWPKDGISKGWFALYYKPPASALVKAMKYAGVYRCAPYLVELMEPVLAALSASNYDCIVPVPLHYDRQWTRSFNQSEILARLIARRLNLPIRTDLIRCRNTRKQATLSFEKRKTNLNDAFRSKSSFEGLRVLLVDDVLTTGATANACAQALRKCGASDVQALAVLGSGRYQTRDKIILRNNR